MLRRLCFLATLFVLLAGCGDLQTPTTAPTPTPPDFLDVNLDDAFDPKSFPMDGHLIFHFNQPMDQDSTRAPLVIVPSVSGEYSWSEDSRTLTFTPSINLKTGVQYKIRIARRLTSATGLTLKQVKSWVLEIPLPPRITSRQPLTSALEPDDLSFTLRFNQKMNKRSVEDSLSVDPEIPLEFSWSVQILTVTLDGEISPGQSFNFSLDSTAKTLDGESIQHKETWTYRIAEISADFQRNAGTSRLETFMIEFNYPMDPRSVEEAIVTSPELDYTLTWQDDGKTLILVPLEPVISEISFTIEDSAEDVSGTALSSMITWTFTPPPTIQSAEWESTIGTRTKFVMSFSLSVDTESFAKAIRISPALSYELDWQAENTRLVLIPLDTPPGLTSYTLRFEGQVFDADGYSIEDLGVYKHSTPPSVTNESMIGYGYWDRWDPTETYTIEFDRPMHPESTLTALDISPPIEGEFNWVDETTLEILPYEGHLTEYTLYQFTLAPTAMDKNGNPALSKEFSWKVETDGLADALSFGTYGADIQVVDMDGPRIVQVGAPGYGSKEQDVDTIKVEIARITLEDYLVFQEFIRANSGVSYGRPKPIFDLSGIGIHASWEVSMQEVNSPYPDLSLPGIVLPESLSEGIYIMNLVTDHVNDQLVVVATTSTVAVKVAEYANGNGQVIVWVSNINGGVLPNTNVRVYDIDGYVIASGKTDKFGIFESALGAGKSPYVVLAIRDDTLTISGVGADWQTRNTSYWYDIFRSFFTTPINDSYFAYLYTDRPIYRPGHQVNYKGIIRQDSDANFSLPLSEKEITVNIRDARSNLLKSYSTTLNDYGTFNGDFTLTEGAMLGEYNLEVVIDGESHKQEFKVEEYEKPDINVEVTTDRNAYVQDETINLAINTTYLFGEPVTNANVAIRWFELAPSYYSYYWDEDADEDEGDSYNWFDSNISDTQTYTDDSGRVEMTFTAELGQFSRGYYYDEEPSSTLYAIEATVDDGSNQYISGFSIIKVVPTAIEIELDLGGFLYNPGEPVPVVAQLSTQFNESIANQPLTLSIEKRRKGTWRDYDYFDEIILVTDEDGIAVESFELVEGCYRLELIGTDSYGNEKSVRRYVYVYDSTSRWWDDFTTEIALHVYQDEYSPGETAEILIESGFSGEGLLTIERGEVLEYRIVPFSAPFTTVKVPILNDYSPNIHVVFQAWEENDIMSVDVDDYYYFTNIPDSKLRFDSVNLTVKDTTHALTITLNADKESYQPRQEANFTIEVTDFLGRPVQAEVSLALVDEAIFLLSEELSEPIHEAFFKPRALMVETYDSMSPYRVFYQPEAGGGGGGEGGLFGNPRSEFPDTVVWYPTVMTDKNGRAEITATLPDTLTTWRMTAKAVTKDTKVGESNFTIVTQQPIVIRPLSPRNLIVGDEFILSAMVHNFSEEELSLEISIESPMLGLGPSDDQTITLAPQEQRMVFWQAVAKETGEARITISAQSGDYVDAVQVNVPIQQLAIPSYDSQAGQFSTEVNVSVNKAANAAPESEIVIVVDRSIAGSLLKGVEYLTGFPYGCVEQTMSRALPNAVVARAFLQLGMSDRIGLAELNPKIEASIQRLYALQHDDGGWGWWFDDPSHPYQTAWVVFGLSITDKAGFPIDPGVIQQGVDYLIEHFDEMDARTLAYALYSMTIAGHGDLDAALELADELTDLDAFGKSALAMTLDTLGETEIANSIMEGLLSEVVTVSTGGAYLEGTTKDGYYDKKYMASSVRSTALFLQALLQIRPEHPLQEDLVQWLMNKRSGRGWGTTNETAFTLLALTDHILAQQMTSEEIEFNVMVNGSLFSTEILKSGELTASIQIPMDDLADGDNEIRLFGDGATSLYYVVSSQMYVAEPEVEAAGIVISRQYLDPDTKKPITQIEEGELVLIRLAVQIPEDSFYIIVEDHLPGGLEALNEGLNTSAHDTVAADRNKHKNTSFYTWEKFRYNYKEIREGRVIFFITSVKKGTHFLEYYARATVSGEFIALPAEVSAMYDMTFWGRSASSMIIISDD